MDLRVVTAALFMAAALPAQDAPEAKPAPKDRPYELMVGDPAPPFSLPRIAADGTPGERVSLPAGQVVVLEFWATWCGPCVKGIPRLNKLHEQHGPGGLAVLGVTDQSKKGIENFMEQTPMKYVVGAGSELASEYGVEGLPHAFVIGRDGKLVWHGDPGDKEFEKQILAALGTK